MDILKKILSRIIYGGGIVFDLAKWFIVVLIILSIVNTFFFSIFVVDGVSMEPNLHDQELVLWNKNAYHDATPKRGDVVVINYPGDPLHKKYVKRVVGLPGERVDIYNGHVYINKQLLNEEYLFNVQTDPAGSWQIDEGKYLVLGDNRPSSNDSRYFGPVESRFVLGHAISIIYPRFSIVSDGK